MYTIVGSGFGLYGYLPAIIESLGGPVILPRSYQDNVNARPELTRYLGAIQWVADAEAALALAAGVVVATTPMRQPEVVDQCLRFASLEFLVLEKPLAATPAIADRVLDTLSRSGKRFRIGYTLLYTAWASHLRVPSSCRFDGKLSITWTFMAHHFARSLRNWKRVHRQGGGVLRFFGVHIIALLASLGYRDAVESTLVGDDIDQPDQWRAIFSGPRLPDCYVLLESRSPENRFRVALDDVAGSTPLADLQEPFQLESPRNLDSDRRVAVLERLLQSLRSDDTGYYALYDEVNLLWRGVETCSIFTAR